MLSIVLAMAAALGYGASDFAGGVAARHADARLVALLSQSVALGVALLLVALPLAARSPRPEDLVWAAAAGFGSAAGNVLIYHGIAHHGATAVAPTSGIVAVAIPVAAALAGGAAISAAPLAGIAVAVPAIWLVSGGGERHTDTGEGRRGSGVLIGAAAGAGFGTQFACLGQTSAAGGMVPLAVSQTVSVVMLLLAAMTGTRARAPGAALSIASVAGLCAGLATASFQIAARIGDLAIAAAITSLYPAVTVLMTSAFSRKWWTQREGVGLMLTAASLVLFSM